MVEFGKGIALESPNVPKGNPLRVHGEKTGLFLRYSIIDIDPAIALYNGEMISILYERLEADQRAAAGEGKVPKEVTMHIVREA